MSEVEFKVEELQRLLDERKITLDQYLEMRAKIEFSEAAENVTHKRSEEPSRERAESGKSNNRDQKSQKVYFLQTDILVAISPLLLLVGIVLMAWNLSSTATRGLATYPYFYHGLMVTATGMFFLIGGSLRHVSFGTTKDSSKFILLEGMGLFFSFLGIATLWLVVSFMSEINALNLTSYYVPIPPWTQGLFSLAMLVGGIFMIIAGLIRGSRQRVNLEVAG